MTNKAAGGDLCTRLTARFSGRGINNPGVIRRVSLEEQKQRVIKTKRAESIKAERAVREATIEPGFTSAKRRLPGRDYRRHGYESFEAERHDFIPDGGKFGAAFERGRRIRERAQTFNPTAYEIRHRIVPESRPAKKIQKRPFGEVFAEKLKSMMPRISDVKASPDEKVVKKTSIPKGIVAAVLLCTVLLMTVLYTYASYTETVSEGKRLQNEKVSLMLERDRLVNLLELRDDVREIEDYAVNTLGMVKSDLVETRYVSIAGGERIEVIRADEPEDRGGFFSTILSAMGTNWERIMEYLD